jgi:MFS superfamily sulfate permease-like transporter
VAQGIGNSLSGLIGGLPITSVIVRSSTNVYTGARTRLSALIHGILILAAVLLIPEFLNRIPLTCLAAVLIMVGYKLTSLQIIRESWEHGIDQFLPFGVTVLGVVFTDLLIGIGLGFAASLFWVLKANRFAAISVSTEADRWTVSFNKDASFVTKSELKRTLQKIPDKVHVTFDATRASVIDHDIYDTIGEFAQAATYRSINIEYINVFGKRKSQQ